MSTSFLDVIKISCFGLLTVIGLGCSSQIGMVAKSSAENSDVAPLMFDGPLTITKGGTYSGNWESLDFKTPAVKVMTSEPVIIENCNLRFRGHGILSPWTNANLIVRNCKGVGLNSMTLGESTGRFFAAEGFQSIELTNNTLVQNSGIYLNGWDGAGTGRIFISENYAENIDGRLSDGKGGYQNDFYRVQFVQLNNIKNNPRVEISWNKVYNQPRASFVEDTINIHASSGTPTNSINIENNLLIGAYQIDPAAAYSGGGIMVGDGCENSGYTTAQNNTVIQTSNYGIAIANGNNQKILNNVILGTGVLKDGTLLDADSDAGIYVRNYCNDPTHDPSTVFATGNKVGWGTPTATNAHGRWDLNNGAAASQNFNNTQISPLDKAIDWTLLDQAIADHESRAKAAGKIFGRR